MQPNDAYLINNVDESLCFFASKASRESDAEWGVYEVADDRDELGRGCIEIWCRRGAPVGERCEEGSYGRLQERVVARPGHF